MTRHMFRRIADDLRDRIATGDLNPGTRLPTHEDLMRQYQTTRITVRRALDELVRERLIVGKPTVGMFVRKQHRYRLEAGEGMPGFNPPFPSFGEQYLAAQSGPFTQTVDVQLTQSPTGVAEQLGDDDPVVLRHRLMFSGKTPVSICNTYYPAGLVAGSDIEQPELIERGSFTVLDELGLAVIQLRNVLFGRTADPAENTEMGWDTGTHVFGQMRTGITGAGVAVVCIVSLIPADNWMMSFDQVRDPGATVHSGLQGCATLIPINRQRETA